MTIASTGLQKTCHEHVAYLYNLCISRLSELRSRVTHVSGLSQRIAKATKISVKHSAFWLRFHLDTPTLHMFIRVTKRNYHWSVNARQCIRRANIIVLSTDGGSIDTFYAIERIAKWHLFTQPDSDHGTVYVILRENCGRQKRKHALHNTCHCLTLAFLGTKYFKHIYILPPNVTHYRIICFMFLIMSIGTWQQWV